MDEECVTVVELSGVPEQLWCCVAGERIAMLRSAAGEVEAAKPLLAEIADDSEAPSGMRARASEILKDVGA